MRLPRPGYFPAELATCIYTQKLECGVVYDVTWSNFPFVAIVPDGKHVMKLLRKKKVKRPGPWFIKSNIVSM